MNKKLKVLTHNGPFHADEVMAIAIISLAFPYFEIEITRSRNKNDVQDKDFVLDVGGEYDPEKGLYDHHQKIFNLRRDNNIPYATAGLIWFNKEISNEAIDSVVTLKDYVPSEHSQKIHQIIDGKLMAPIDAIDSGHYRPEEGTYHFSQMIGSFNALDPFGPEQEEQFFAAIEAAKTVLKNELLRTAKEVVEEEKTKELINEQIGSDVLVLPRYLPWQAALKDNLLGFRRVIWEDPSGQYRIQAVDETAYFPKEWRGLSGQELDQVSKIEGGVFCHPAGFIAGHKTKEGALAMAKSR